MGQPWENGISTIYLWNLYGISVVYGSIYGISMEYLWFMGISIEYLWNRIENQTIENHWKTIRKWRFYPLVVTNIAVENG